MPVPGVRCGTCQAGGREVWVIPGRCCSLCRTPALGDFSFKRPALKDPPEASEGADMQQATGTTLTLQQDSSYSLNEQANKKQLIDSGDEVASWLAGCDTPALAADLPPSPRIAAANQAEDGISNEDIPFGQRTVNRLMPEQLYFTEDLEDLDNVDAELMQQVRNWSDAPILPTITENRRCQPESSRGAIAEFNKMCQETDLVLSRAATWGTRRSLDDIQAANDDAFVTGKFLKKLSLKPDQEWNKPSVFQSLRELIRKPSNRLKRQPSSSIQPQHSGSSYKDSSSSPAPPGRSGSWGSRTTLAPSINTVLVSMSPRSKIEFESPGYSYPNLVGQWKKSGGPPVVRLLSTRANTGGNENYEDDDDESDDSSLGEAIFPVLDIEPNLDGFGEHILRLNPKLRETNTYLVDRIAKQQVVRYKLLSDSHARHQDMVSKGGCPCGTLCSTLAGGSVVLQDATAEPHGIPSETTSDSGYHTIMGDSFPPGIPLPPVDQLPANFECQLCFQAKSIKKTSDWTKHVYEDIQPLTCTWDRCREPKLFKRKADWVRHENEAHRHLEWWTCDIDDCRHTCYRRDNFLQHLVREHKLAEPKAKTKAAIKRAGVPDPTWQRVEACNVWTTSRPQDEPCRFCGKILPTWKKLTVHLAKHMEQIALPILQVVAKSSVSHGKDATISPAEDHTSRPRPLEPMSATANVFYKQEGDLNPEIFSVPLRDTPISASSSSPRFADSTGPFNSIPVLSTMPVMTFSSAETPQQLELDIDEAGIDMFKKEAIPLDMSPSHEYHLPLHKQPGAFPEETNTVNFSLTQPAAMAATQPQVSDKSTQTTPISRGLLVSTLSNSIPSSPSPEDCATSGLDKVEDAENMESVQIRVSSRNDRPPRRTGVANIRIILHSLSLGSEYHEPNDASSEMSLCSKERSGEDEDEDEDDVGDDDHNGEGPGQNTEAADDEGPEHTGSGQMEGCSTSSGAPTSQSQANHQDSQPRQRKDDGRDTGDRGNGRKRRRQSPDPSGQNSRTPRYACPYQAHEPWQDCLRRGPRNPRGGCNGINRLKQHLNRRHMLSFRCPRCWISFDTRGKAAAHPERVNCEERPMQAHERFMNPEQERELDRCCATTSEEDIWWNIFQLLITNEQTSDMQSLRSQYCPYYNSAGMSITIPAINFSDVTFSQPSENTPFEFGGLSGILGSRTLGSSSSASSASLSTSAQGPIFLSDMLSIPIFESPSAHGQGQGAPAVPSFDPFQVRGSDLSAHAATLSSTPVSSAMTTTVFSSTSTTSTPASLATQTAPTEAGQTQLRRAYDRLQVRHARLEAEATELREHTRLNRTDLGQVDMIVDKLLADGDLQGALLEQVSQVSEILLRVNGRL